MRVTGSSAALPLALPRLRNPRRWRVPEVYRCMHGVKLLEWDDAVAASAKKNADGGTSAGTRGGTASSETVEEVGETTVSVKTKPLTAGA